GRELLRLHRHRVRPRWLRRRHPRGPAGHEDRRRGEGRRRRSLPELRVHPRQGGPALGRHPQRGPRGRVVRHQGLRAGDRLRRDLRPAREGHQDADRRRGRAVQEEHDRPHRGRGVAGLRRRARGRPGDQGRQGHHRDRVDPQADPRHAVRRADHRHRGGLGVHRAARLARRRRRRRVGVGDRVGLRAARLGGPPLRGPGPRPALRGPRHLQARRARAEEAGDEGPHQDARRERPGHRHLRHLHGRGRAARGRLPRHRRRARPGRRGARARGRRRQARRPRPHRRRRRAAHLGRRRLRDRRPRQGPRARAQGLRRGDHRRRGRRGQGHPPAHPRRHPARDVLHAERRLVRPHRAAGQGRRLRRRRRQAAVRRGRRRHGLRRPPGPGQGRRREEVRRAAGRPHRRHPRDRAHPGARQHPRARGRDPRARAHRPRPPDAVGGRDGSRARCRRLAHPRL
ncbi:MAG: Dihydrolipoamide dehydrogenase, partial [uncultured Solirubrobacteraceae bacterium]